MNISCASLRFEPDTFGIESNRFYHLGQTALELLKYFPGNHLLKFNRKTLATKNLIPNYKINDF